MSKRRVVIAALLLVALAGAVGTAFAGEPPQPGKLPAIKPNTWADAKARYVRPKHIGGSSWATGDGYCGSTYRSKTGTIIFRSGIRSKSAGLSPGFYSNATLEWDLRTNEVRVVEVANWGGGSSGGGRLLPAFKKHPTPTPRHTYDGLTYVERQDAMYFMLGANWRVASRATPEAKAQHSLDNNSTWKYTFADGKWHRIDHNIRKFWDGRRALPYESHLQHWPGGDKLLFFDSNGRCYAEFDLKTEQWGRVDLKSRPPMSFYNARSTWDSKRQLWVFRLGPKVCTFDPRGRTFKALPSAGGTTKGGYTSIAYISKHDAYIIAGPTGNDTKVYDIAKGKWIDVPGGDIKLVNGYAQYDPKADLVGLVYQRNAFKFRYVPKE